MINNEKDNLKAGIYVHVPFCTKKCKYCSFYSIEDKRFEDYLKLIEKSIDSAKIKLPLTDSIYFGGGTPSLLPPEYIDAVLNKINSKFNISDDTEITLELNPGTIDEVYFKKLLKTGVNRLNIGVQSFSDKNLKLLGRIHSSKKAVETYFNARHTGFSNIGLDLIYGIPEQSEKELFSDLEFMVSLKPEHISAYMLTLEKNTPFYLMNENKEIFMPSEELLSGFFLKVLRFFGSNGYKFYEISNYAVSEKYFSRHNQKYWNLNPYLGFGPSAHSFVNNKRWSEPSSFDIWSSNILNCENKGVFYEETDIVQQKTEFIFLGLRTKKGIDSLRYKKFFNEDFFKKFDVLIKEYCKKNLLEISGDFLFLSEKGFLFSDYISLKFVENI
jgi:oxygen-independent coproporphyrinogen-3 oxidase